MEFTFLMSFPRNVAEALVSKGYATVVRYRQDDDQRSAHYDELLAAENRAQKKSVGVHSKKDVPAHKVADVSGVGQTFSLGEVFASSVWVFL